MDANAATRNHLANIGRSLAERVKGKKEGAPEPPSKEPAAAKGGSIAATGAALPAPPPTPDCDVRDIPLATVVDSPFQPRQRALTKRDVDELMRSLSASGQTSPIIVAPGQGELDGRFVVHAGHRRCAALRFLGATTVKAIVRADLDERAARKLTLVDNLGRADLSAFEQATALKAYAEAYSLSVEASGAELGLTRSDAYRLKCLLGASERLLELFREHGISARPAELLAKLEGKNARRAIAAAKRFVDGGMTVKALEEEYRRGDARGARAVAARRDVELTMDRRALSLKLRITSASRSDGQTQRVVEALRQVLAYLGVPQVEAGDLPIELGAKQSV